MKKFAASMLAALLMVGLAAGCDKPAQTDAVEAGTTATPKAAPEAAENTESAENAEAPAAEEEGGQWVSSVRYGVKFRVPEDWSVNATEDGVSANAPDDTTTVVLVGSESENMIQSAINDLKAKIEIKDVQFEKTSLTTINGLPGTRGSGVAVLVLDDGDQEIEFSAMALRVGKHTVTMMIFSQAEMYEAQKEIIDGIAQTITKS